MKYFFLVLLFLFEFNAQTATDSEKLNGLTSSQLQKVHSIRNFTNGTLIQTSIDYSVTSGDSWILEITGNSYGEKLPFDLQYQGYIYNNTVINHGGLSNGKNITGMSLFNYNGKLCFWFPYQAYWQGFNVSVYSTSVSGVSANTVTSITNVSKPSGISKEVSMTFHQSYSSSVKPTPEEIGALSINQTASNSEKLGNLTSSQLQKVHSIRNFTNGTLIQTSIDYSVTSGDSWILEITGNSYGEKLPFDLQYQGYIYNNTVINHGGLSNGKNITGMSLFNYNGKLCFWFPYQAYWQGFNVSVYSSSVSGVSANTVTDIKNVSKPSGISKEVFMTFHQSYSSSVKPTPEDIGALSITGGEISGNLAIKGEKGLEVKKIKVTTSPELVPDYVFENGYILQSLEEVESFIKKEKHLPNIPSAKEIARDKLDLVEMQLKLLEKIEELTLHTIRQEKMIKKLEKELREK